MNNEKRIEYHNVLWNLEEKQGDIIQEYVDELKEQISDLESQIGDLESEKDELEYEVSSLQEDLDRETVRINEHIVSLIREITEERYKYSKQNLVYTTADKILDRLDYILKYEV